MNNELSVHNYRIDEKEEYYQQKIEKVLMNKVAEIDA